MALRKAPDSHGLSTVGPYRELDCLSPKGRRCLPLIGRGLHALGSIVSPGFSRSKSKLATVYGRALSKDQCVRAIVGDLYGSNVALGVIGLVSLNVEAAYLRIHSAQLRVIEEAATGVAAGHKVASANRSSESEDPDGCPIHD